MKQVLFLGAIYALIFHQSNKNAKMESSGEQQKKQKNIIGLYSIYNSNDFDNTAEKFITYKTFLNAKQKSGDKYFDFTGNQ